MGTVFSLCAVATQGHGTGSHWTTSYKVDLSTDGVTWSVYKENNFEKAMCPFALLGCIYHTHIFNEKFKLVG